MTYDIGSFVFDNWVIVREIGSGAYGKVYEIRRNDYGITAKSALKVIRIPPSQSDVRSAVSGGMDEEAVSACFEGSFSELIQEIQFMAELQSHPNIVSYQDHKVIDLKPEIGWDIQIRMELLESLTNYQIKNDRMSEQQIMKLGIDIASALELSEEKGIIHCDIKPDNIFIDPAGNFKLSDFGVAKAVDKTMGGHSKKGTEIYMAPEIYLGKPYGKTVDIYSLGLVLYQLANQNRLPFYPINSTIVSDIECEEALSRRMRGDAVPAPLNVSSYLTTIILKAIAYDPDRRWQSAGELRKTLERIQSLMVSSSEPIRFDNMKTPEEDEETTGFFEEYSQKEAEKEPVPQPPRETAPEKERPDQSIQTNQTSSKHTSTTILKEEVEEGYQSFAGNSASNSGHKPGYGIAIRFIDLNENENNKESEVIPRRKKQLLIGIVVLVALAAGIAAFFLLRDRFTSGPKETITADENSDVRAQRGYQKASEAEREVALAAISVGDYITFGSYEQDNDTADGNEPIEWLVLKREGEKILVISRYGLESKCYNEEYANITWENCTLRKWLNDTFYEEAFSETARQMIIKATAKVGDNEKCGSKYVNDTEDNIFLLSISETEELFKDNNARICYPTEHVKAQGYYVDGEHDSCFWWLRSPGANWGRSAFIDLHGQLYETGAAVQSESGVVRPALWINLAPELVSYVDSREATE